MAHQDNTDGQLLAVSHYYTCKLNQFGPTHQGVDWNSAASQELRFQQLLKLLPVSSKPFSINDYGCGYGALLDYLRREGYNVDYAGYDISASMIEEATRRHGPVFCIGTGINRVADYSVACGVFNVRLSIPDAQWRDHVFHCLDLLNECSAAGFGFNCLTSYSDPEHRKDYLYYGNPLEFFDHCKRRYARNICLLHDYELYEFTILVRKDTARPGKRELTPGAEPGHDSAI